MGCLVSLDSRPAHRSCEVAGTTAGSSPFAFNLDTLGEPYIGYKVQLWTIDL